jgi:carbon-monoxide dehydrogenase large subunit
LRTPRASCAAPRAGRPNATRTCRSAHPAGRHRPRPGLHASVNDIGRVFNPTIATGQVEGGAVQCIGQALGEQVVHDAHTAQLMTASFSDYAMPRAADTPLLWRTQFDTSVPTALDPLGAKGVGELGTMARGRPSSTPSSMRWSTLASDATSPSGCRCR